MASAITVPESPHHFVFGPVPRNVYRRVMSYARCRRLIATATAMLFVLSIVAHGFVVGGMAAEMAKTMPAASAGMTMQDGMDCDTACSNDAGMHMTCFAHCAALTGILTEPAPLRLARAAQTVLLATADPLVSVHGPPEPRPPKPILT
jgi:hypothetical protein